MKRQAREKEDCEFVVVGSGAGGGTVAARLADAGHTVTLLEAGGDPRELCGGSAVEPGADRLPVDYDVPAFHAFASENDALKWDFFVHHYADEEQQRRDTKYVPSRGGVLYPRAGCLGGCTAHNAMILAYPQNSDWDYIAELTQDPSWYASNMRRYFQRLEACRHRPLYRLLSLLGINPTRHGWSGWLPTEVSFPLEVLANKKLVQTIGEAAFEAFLEDGHPAERIRWAFESGLDPNDWRLVESDATGIRYLPLTTRKHARKGARERVLAVARKHPDRLKVVLDALVTRVMIDETGRAIGVEYLKGARLYRAHANPSTEPGRNGEVRASREVILASGAFNTPQLLMLSGIGPETDLRRHGIRVRAHLPGVGRNLQDRYEIGVVNRIDADSWAVFRGARFTSDDPQFEEWRDGRAGIYTGNGSLLTLFRRSPVANASPDVFCMSMLARFCGYFPGYSSSFPENLNYLSWVVLKAHTGNRSGTVTLRSTDPRDPPAIDFNYFAEGGDSDLTAVVDGIRFVRRLTGKVAQSGLRLTEEMPGVDIVDDADLRDYVRNQAWGHHACGTCAIGAPSEGGVLSGDFRVHGVSGLRVVDASVFPRIPGFFIACSVYMIGEKAADAILRDSTKSH